MPISTPTDHDPFCKKCGARLILRRAPPPTIRQILFGVSFIAFLIFADETYRTWGNTGFFGWGVVQLLLGLALAQGRLQAQKRIYRCVVCEPTVR